MIRMAAKAQPVAWSCSITMFDALKFAQNSAQLPFHATDRVGRISRDLGRDVWLRRRSDPGFKSQLCHRAPVLQAPAAQI